MTSVDIAPLISAVAQLAIPIIGTVIYALIQSRIKDQDAKAAVLRAIENGVSFGMNKVDGALKGRPLSVNLGSSVATQAVKYVLDRVPDAAKRINLDAAGLAKIAVAKLPGVEGHISDEAVNGIAAAATGNAVATGGDMSKLVESLGPVIQSAVEAAVASKIKSDTKPVSPDVQVVQQQAPAA